jgi:hypothetical protein
MTLSLAQKVEREMFGLSSELEMIEKDVVTT